MQASGSIVLSKLQIENDEYQIVSSAEDIARFYTGEGVYETSPQVLKIQLYKNGEQIDFSDSYKFYYCVDWNDSNEPLDEEYLSMGLKEDGEIADNQKNLYFYIEQLVKNNLFFQSEPLIFVFEYIQNNETIVSKAFQFRDGVTQDIAKFNLTAAAINASVGVTGMNFTQEGLEIRDGGFKITQNDQSVFSFESVTTSDGQNISKLTLRGAVYADEGEFTGKIHATDASFDRGTIGGFNIENNKLTSIGTTILQDQSSVSSIELDGTSGKITAHDIELGNKATILNQIQLGKAYIYNPTKNNDLFIKSGDIVIKDTGEAEFGSIEVDGANSEIRGANWYIGNNHASFSNINVSGAIESAVFKTNSVQAAGGVMIFRPSYKGELTIDEGQIIIMLENDFLGEIGNQIQIIYDSNDQIFPGIVDMIDKNDKRLLKITTENLDLETGNILIIDYGTTSETQVSTNILMGINSGNTSAGLNGHILPRGLTLTSLNEVPNNPNLYLGDLKEIGYTGYGLYADNVFLNGSLTTKVGENSYAGVNTLNGTKAIAFGENYEGKELPKETDESKIVFWAGASGKTDDEIKKAYFQVTEQGSVYAQRAKLTDTLIVGGTIQATEIQTISLSGKEGELSIYDGAKGIRFMSNENTALFSIKTDGMQLNDSSKFVAISDNKVEFIGEKLRTKGDNYLELTAIEKVPTLQHKGTSSVCGFYFDEASTLFRMNSKNIQTWESDGVILHDKLRLQGSERSAQLEYRPVDAGYDLYIISS